MPPINVVSRTVSRDVVRSCGWPTLQNIYTELTERHGSGSGDLLVMLFNDGMAIEMQRAIHEFLRAYDPDDSK